MAFPTTRGSMVTALASSEESIRSRAFDALAGLYWKPLYKYARCTHALGAEEAEDSVQSFLATAFERNTVASYDPARASFRTYLRLLFDRQILNERKALSRQKRGGHVLHIDVTAVEAELDGEHPGTLSPEQYFQSQWIRSVFEAAVLRLKEESRAVDFAVFAAYDLDEETISYQDLANRFALPVTTITNRLAATRRRFRETLLELVREVTTTESEFRSEVRALLGVDR